MEIRGGWHYTHKFECMWDATPALPELLVGCEDDGRDAWVAVIDELMNGINIVGVHDQNTVTA